MIRRSTWIFVAVFVGLLGITVYLQRSGYLEEEAEPLPTPRPQLLNIDASLIRHIELESADGERVILDKDAQGAWQLIEPAGKQIGNPTSLDAVIKAIASLQALNALENAIAADVIGLSPAAYTLTVRTNDGRQLVLRFGSKTPTGSGYYVQNENGKLFVISTLNFESVFKLLSDPTILVTPTPEISPTPAAATSGEGATATPKP
jgi:hypothetical protein